MLRTNTHQHGFTLIELVIVVALLSLVMVTTIGGLTQILESKRALDDNRDGSMLAGSVISRLTRELQLAWGQNNVLPPRDNLNTPYPQDVALIGTAQEKDNADLDSITFLALEGGQYLPDGSGHSGLVQITYKLLPPPPEEIREEGDKGLYYLVREETPYIRPASRAYEKIMIFPISKRITSLRFRYYFERNGDSKWVSSWGDTNRGLPNLVEFSLVVRSPSGVEKRYTSTVALSA